MYVIEQSYISKLYYPSQQKQFEEFLDHCFQLEIPLDSQSLCQSYLEWASERTQDEQQTESHVIAVIKSTFLNNNSMNDIIINIINPVPNQSVYEQDFFGDIVGFMMKMHKK